MTTFVLHVGMSKTGTSTLQRAVFQDHSQILYLGKSRNSACPRECRTERIFKILAPLLWHPKRFTNYGKLKRRFDTHIRSQALENQIVLASWEGLGLGSTAEFKKLLGRVRMIAPDMKLMICLRNPLTWIESEYLQHLQGQYAYKNRDEHFKQSPYLSFDDWLESMAELKGGVRAWLCYAQNIKNAISTIARENVGVFLFEELRSKPTEYYTSIAEFLDINVAEVLQLASNLHHNKRLLQTEVDFIKSVNASDSRRDAWLSQSPRERRREMHKNMASSSAESAPAKVNLSDAWKVKVEDGTREGNNWLSQNLGMDLGACGYPV